MRQGLVSVVLFVVVLVSVGRLHAFDGQRQGFILGGGFGPGLTSFDYSVNGWSVPVSSDSHTRLTFNTNFRVGVGLGQHVQVYWCARGIYFGLDKITLSSEFGSQDAEIDAMVLTGVAGLGVSYFLRPTAPSWYLMGQIGYSTWGMPFECCVSTWHGPGYALGVGYEFAPRWSVEGVVTVGSPDGDCIYLDGEVWSADDASVSPVSVRLTLDYLFY